MDYYVTQNQITIYVHTTILLRNFNQVHSNIHYVLGSMYFCLNNPSRKMHLEFKIASIRKQ